MKRQINLNIASPCSEKFENFHSTDSGGYCSSCQKNVIDFTKMSDDEIKWYFKNDAGKTCGRFKASQLKTYAMPSEQNNYYSLKWVKAGLLGFTILFSGKQSVAKPINQSSMPVEVHPEKKSIENKGTTTSGVAHTVKGTVVDELGEPIPGANVVVRGTTIGTVTDIDGRFILNDVPDNSVLMFYFIGYETQEYKLRKLSSESEMIEMKMVEMEIDFMGEVAVDEVYFSKPTLWQRIKNIFQ